MKLEKTDLIILNFMIKNLETEYSIREISILLKRPYVKIHNSIKRLEKKEIIKINVKGRSHYCSVYYKKNVEVISFVSYQRARGFLDKNKKIAAFISNIEESLKFPDYSLILFGSYAKGIADKSSDIDLAIISHKDYMEEIRRVFSSIKRTSSLEIHFLEFTYDEFIEMLKSKENNVGKEIVKNQIIFKGSEQFYNCLTLAR